MKYLKILGIAAVAAMALMAVTAGIASATTGEIGGVVQNSSFTITTSLKAGTSAILKDTAGISSNTCTASSGSGTTSSPFTGATLTGVGTTMSMSSCAREPVIGDKTGTLHFTWTSGTNGTVTSSGAEITTSSPFGTLNCKTGEGTHLGTFTGVKVGNATMDVNAVISCSGISSKFEATYSVTSPSGLGAVN